MNSILCIGEGTRHPGQGFLLWHPTVALKVHNRNPWQSHLHQGKNWGKCVWKSVTYPKKRKKKSLKLGIFHGMKDFPIQGSHKLVLVSPIMQSNPPFKYTIDIFSGCLHPMFYQIFVSIFVFVLRPFWCEGNFV